MFFRFILTVVSLMTFLHDNHASICEENCPGKPVFTPSRLVVKFGHSTSATCAACQGDCHDKTFGLEKSVGDVTKNGTTLFWMVGNLTDWDPSPYCHYYDTDSGDQCCTFLPVIVYQPPENVSISFVNHSGPMIENSQNTLQCVVENVAPVGSLVVTFYRGQTQLNRQNSSKDQMKPATETFTLEVNISREDDGAQYWCEAKLELGAEGPQPPPVVKSETITATVHYGPYLQKTGNQETIRITEGDSLQLNCSAVGNPSPSYTWTVPAGSQSSVDGSVVSITSVGSEHKGEYICTASSEDRTAAVTYTVDVQADVLPYIIAAVLIAAVVIVFLGLFVYFQYYRRYRMGQYNFKDVLKFHKRQPVPLEA